MEKIASAVVCDGCGLPASAEHIAGRLARLELSTRFRPVHIAVLFVALAPLPEPEDDFYAPAGSKAYFEAFMDAVGIGAGVEKSAPESDASRLAEFQHRGYYLACLSECPIPPDTDRVTTAISSLGQTLVRRIRFNYRPKRVAVLGTAAAPLLGVLEQAGLGPMLLQDGGRPWVIPKTDDFSARARLQAALSTRGTDENPGSGYDRI